MGGATRVNQWSLVGKSRRCWYRCIQRTSAAILASAVPRTTTTDALIANLPRKYCPLRALGFSPQYAPHFGSQDPAVCGRMVAARTWRNHGWSRMTAYSKEC